MAIIKISGFQCERCSHAWAPRNKSVPVVCPKCKSPYYNRKRRAKK